MTMEPISPISGSGNIVIALQAFIALIVILIVATAIIILFVSRVGNKLKDITKNMDKRFSGIEAKLDGYFKERE